MKPNYLILLLVTTGILVIDQVTKIYIDIVMDLHQSYTIIENFFNITYIRNKGAAFGFLANTQYRLPFFISISIIAVIVIIIAFRKLRSDQKMAMVSLSMILAGAIGNLIDRMRLGEVIDFIYVHWYEHYWPAFNVADSAICVGVFLLAIDMLHEEHRQKLLQQPPSD